MKSEKLKDGAPGKEQWGRLGGGFEEFMMNFVLFAHTAITVVVWAALGGYTHAEVVVKIAWVLFTAFAIHAGSHKMGQWTTDGRSRESLVGETAIKALLALVTGRDMNRGGQAASTVETAAASATSDAKLKKKN